LNCAAQPNASLRFRVLRGQAEKLFVSGGGEFGIEASE
jgi:hypothetical protein